MRDNSIIHIFYACDDDFVKYTLVSISSLIKNADKYRKYCIHILNTGICDKMRNEIKKYADDTFEITFDDVTKHLSTITSRLPLRDYYSKTTYYRLFIAEMFSEYDKVIYLDSDTIIAGDISKLYDVELGDYYVGAVKEEVMVQEDVYGTYAEKVVGIDRNRFFNAGMLLINCEQFRQNKVLDRFVELLYEYNFVVTQDEDYLNLICKDKVKWLGREWNTEVFGKIELKQSEINIFHYIMVSKPWHYENCRYADVFWKYAKDTVVYEEIKKELETYTDEQKKQDDISAECLMQTAINEINKENNYLNLLKSGRLKSKDRIMVLNKIALLEKEGKFDIDVEEDPPTKELLPDDIDYLREKFSSRLKARVSYKMARKFLNNIVENKQLIIKEIKGIENFQKLNTGAIITCNHFNAFDSFAMQLAFEASGHTDKTFYRVIREGNYTNFPGFYGILMRNCNTFPLSSNKKTMEKFISSMNKVLQNGDFMLFYPEQSMWWNYRKPKPLKKGAYNFAVRNNVPVLPCFITMEDSDVLGNDGFYVQEYTIHVAEPIYPDKNKSKIENMEEMKNKNYHVWKQIYEETYGEPLVYSCDEVI